MDDATRTDDLPGLVERLRKARPDLIARMPWPCDDEWHYGDPWYCIDPVAAAEIVGFVCAKEIAALPTKRYQTHSGCNDGRWHVSVFDDAHFNGEIPIVREESPDFLTALVSAVIALAKEDRSG